MSDHYKPVHIRDIVPGDTVLHDGREHTVSANNIRRDPFMGRTLFGDCYRLGTRPVMRKVFDTPKTSLRRA